MSQYYQEDERAPLRSLSRPARTDVTDEAECDFGQLLKDILVAVGWAQPTPPRPTIEDMVTQRRNAVWFYDRRFGFRERQREQEQDKEDDSSWSDDTGSQTSEEATSTGPEAESPALDPSGKGMYI